MITTKKRDGSVETVGEPPTLEAVKATALAKLAALRWQKTQSFAFDGETGVPADPAANIVNSTLSLRDRLGAPVEAVQTWKLKSPGVFRSWAYDDIEQYGFAIAAHIQACFNREKALTDQIMEAADVSAVYAVDISTGWPT